MRGQFQVVLQIRTGVAAVEDLRGQDVGARDQRSLAGHTREEIRQRFASGGGCKIIVRNGARAQVVALDFHAVQPDNGAVIHTGTHDQIGELRQIRDDEF